MKDENRKIARLVKQIQRGKQSAFEEFYKLTSPKAYFIALKITQNEHDAEDILQESYIKALEKIGEIDTSQNITSWFLKIVANKSKDLLKSRNRLVFDGDEECVFDDIPEEKTEFRPEENLDQEELRLEVMAAIDELTEEKRACIMMMYFGDMSVKEIAESIEVPESTVKNRLYTARKDLKSKFEKSGTVVHGIALGGVLIWALNKTSLTASAGFLASAASAQIAAGITAAYSSGATAATAAAASGAAASTAASAASAGTGIAAKVAVLSVAQKVAAGVAATAIIGGSSAGVATVVKHVVNDEPTTEYHEEVTTAPVLSTKYAFSEITLPTVYETTLLSTDRETRKTETERTSRAPNPTKPTSSERVTETKPTTTVKVTTTKPTTTQKMTTTTQKETTTLRPTTTHPTTAKPTTTRPTTTTPATQAKATVKIDIIDLDGSVIDTVSLEVEAGTTLSREYIVTAVQAKGYEPMAGVYGDIGSVAQSGNTYNFEAEL